MELITLILGAIIGIFASKYSDAGLPDVFAFPTLSYDGLFRIRAIAGPSRTIPIYVYDAQRGAVDAVGTRTLPQTHTDVASLLTVAALVMILFLVLVTWVWAQLNPATDRLPLVTDVLGDALAVTLPDSDCSGYLGSHILDTSSIDQVLAKIIRSSADIRAYAHSLPSNGTGSLILRSYPTIEIIPLLRYLNRMLNAEITVAGQVVNVLNFLWTIGDREAQIAYTINRNIACKEMEERMIPQIFEIDRLEGENSLLRSSPEAASNSLEENERLRNALRNRDRGMDFERLQRKLSIQEAITNSNVDALRKKEEAYEALEVEHLILEQSTGWMHERIEELEKQINQRWAHAPVFVPRGDGEGDGNPPPDPGAGPDPGPGSGSDDGQGLLPTDGPPSSPGSVGGGPGTSPQRPRRNDGADGLPCTQSSRWASKS